MELEQLGYLPLIHIISFLTDARDLLHLKQTCKYYYSFIEELPVTRICDYDNPLSWTTRECLPNGLEHGERKQFYGRDPTLPPSLVRLTQMRYGCFHGTDIEYRPDGSEFRRGNFRYNEYHGLHLFQYETSAEVAIYKGFYKNGGMDKWQVVTKTTKLTGHSEITRKFYKNGALTIVESYSGDKMNWRHCYCGRKKCKIEGWHVTAFVSYFKGPENIIALQ